MADLSITAANIIPVSGYGSYFGTSGGTITAGLVCYLDSTTDTVKAADNDDTAAKATVKGIALNAASANQPIKLITGGSLGMGAILTVGEIYVLSATGNGEIAPEGDLASGDYVSILGVASTTSNLILNIFNSGAQVP